MKVDANTWVFPVDEYAVLDFLKKYTGGSLKSIYLHVACTTILTYLKESCGNLETISFISATDPPNAAMHKMAPSDLDPNHFHNHACIIPESIKVLEFALDNFNYTARQGKLLTCFQKFKNLQRLTITGLNPQYLSSDSFIGLSQDLTEINFLKLSVPRRGYLGYGRPVPSYSSRLCNALFPLLKITEMRVFRISIINPRSELNIEEFLSGIADKWHNLRTLALVGIHPPSNGIVRSIMTSLTQLRELELYGGMVTDETVSLIAEYLKLLTSLKLSNGTYTSSGIKALCGHPSIERLYLMQRNQRQLAPDWVLAVYDVILSLPNINYVKLVGYRVIAIHAKEDIPAVSSTIQIEVQNLDEPLRDHRQLRMGRLD